MKMTLKTWTAALFLTGSLMTSCGSQKENTNTDIIEQGTESDIPKPSKKPSKVSPLAITSGTVGQTTIAIVYSKPSVKGRTVWGGLVPFGEVWRTGANEATTITFDKEVTIESQTVAAGKYALFTIPTDNGEWTIILNKAADQWGAFDYDKNKDAIRITAKAIAKKEVTEQMTFTISEKGEVSLLWDKLSVSFIVQ